MSNSNQIIVVLTKRDYTWYQQDNIDEFELECDIQQIFPNVELEFIYFTPVDTEIETSYIAIGFNPESESDYQQCHERTRVLKQSKIKVQDYYICHKNYNLKNKEPDYWCSGCHENHCCCHQVEVGFECNSCGYAVCEQHYKRNMYICPECGSMDVWDVHRDSEGFHNDDWKK